MAAARRRSRRSAKQPPAHRWPLLLGLLVLVAVVGVSVLVWSRTERGQATLLHMGADALYGQVQARVDSLLVATLPAYQGGPLAASAAPDSYDWPLPDRDPPAAIRCRVVAIDRPDSWWQVQDDLARRLRAVGARVLWGERLPPPGAGPRAATPHERRDVLRLDVGVTGRATHTLLLYREGTRRPEVRWGGDPASAAWRELVGDLDAPLVAIVIDDWGYRSDATTSGLVALPAPLTMAVLPGQAYSRKFALEATELALPAVGAQGDDALAARRRLASGTPVTLGLGADSGALDPRRREVMLHLPMQSVHYPDVDPGQAAVMVGMPREEIAALLDRALASLPNVRGVNNHQGSAATADEATMTALMEVIAGRDLYFLDSLTSSASVAHDRARAAGVPTLRNRVFLDNDHEDPASIRERLHRLARAARATGAAVGIGHPHPRTLQVLQREIPALQADGVRFVTVSELLALLDERGRAVVEPTG
ncbi:hypothetical protein GF314_16515 [bacterium]|nr:hypothetical protein [bacterium]